MLKKKPHLYFSFVSKTRKLRKRRVFKTSKQTNEQRNEKKGARSIDGNDVIAATTAMTSSWHRGFRWRPCRRSAALRCRSSSLVRWWPEKTPRSWSVRPSPCPGRGSSCPRSVGSRESNLWLWHFKEVPTYWADEGNGTPSPSTDVLRSYPLKNPCL